jgi:hypothetical protein
VLEGRYQAGIGFLPVNYPELETRELLDEERLRSKRQKVTLVPRRGQN